MNIPTDSVPAHHPVRPGTVCQPCSEACAAFHPIDRGGWSDHGLCLNPQSPFSGYPVRTGRDCASYRVQGAADFTRAS